MGALAGTTLYEPAALCIARALTFTGALDAETVADEAMRVRGRAPSRVRVLNYPR